MLKTSFSSDSRVRENKANIYQKMELRISGFAVAMHSRIVVVINV